MSHFKGLVLAFIFGVATVQAALVVPDLNSKISTKKILILNGTNTSSHPLPKAAAETMLHRILDTLLHIPVANRTFAGTSLSQVTTAGLANYDIVIFNYFFETQLMSTAQQNAIKAWLALGNKGYIGYHTSGANEQNEWNWYRDSVTSMQYRLHSGSAQSGTINRTTDTSIVNSSMMAGLPTTWTGIDEWYTYSYGLTWGDTSNTNHNANVRVMYYLNEKSLPTPLPDPMGTHPAAWYREDANKTRYFYSIFAHDQTGAASDFFGSILLRSMEYVSNYNPTPIVNGSAIHKNGVIYLSSQHALQVESKGSHQLKIWSVRGKLLYSVKGQGSRVYQPEIFRNPGIYLAKVESKDGVFTEKVMIQ